MNRIKIFAQEVNGMGCETAASMLDQKVMEWLTSNNILNAQMNVQTCGTYILCAVTWEGDAPAQSTYR